MSRLFENIGRSLLLCQGIELALGFILLMERKKTFVQPSEVEEEIAQFRAQVMSGLKSNLEREKCDFSIQDFWMKSSAREIGLFIGSPLTLVLSRARSNLTTYLTCSSISPLRMERSRRS